MKNFLRCIALLSVLVSMGCAAGDAALHVNLRTDYVPAVEWDEARIFLVKPDGQEVHVHTATAADYIAGARVRSFEGLAEGNYEVRAELLTPDRRILGSRRQAFTLAQETFATVLISRSCSGIVCPMSNPEATECSGGRCVSPDCSETNPAACEDGCVADSDCVSLAACATGVCTLEGACLFMPIEGECSAAEYCDSEVGCVPAIRSDDAGVADSSTPDVFTPDAGAGDGGPPDDVGFDAGAPSCGMPCDTGNACELGVFDCSTGAPVCTSAGAGNAGVTCREASGLCDAAEVCDGASTECPADARVSAGTECRPDAGECDVAEVCDGTSSACPLDAFEAIGTACSGGSCDETHTCSDTCSAGAACTPTNICRQGQIDCTGGTPTCVPMGNVTNGTECAATEYGSYGACGGFGGTCDETGTESRSVTANTCQSGSCTADVSSETRACMRGTEGGSCGAVTMGGWSACGGFSGTCDETGTRTRMITTPVCASGACDNGTSTDTEACSRTTNGTSCGGVTYGGWGSCGGFSGTCDSTGTESRNVFTPTCGSGSCSSVTSSQSRACTRSTNGSSCGSVTYGGWGACGGFSNACDTTGTESRSVFTPTCSSDSCSSVTSSQSRACTRTTNGMSCGSVTYGGWGACGGFSGTCDSTGTESRSVFTPTCGGGSCSSTTTSQSRACTRTTNGTSCGSVTYGSWGACGGFSDICDNTGTESRSVFTPTCSSDSCSSTTTSQSRACSRNTNGNSCNHFPSCRRGTCSAGSCNLTGSACNSPNRCCEPGICVSSGQECP